MTLKELLIAGKLAGGNGGGGGLSLEDYLNRTAPEGSVSVPSVTKLHGYSFMENEAITDFSAASITRIGEGDFWGCSNLTNVSMPNLVYASDIKVEDSSINYNNGCMAFRECHNLGNIHLPKLEKTGTGLFFRCGFGQSTYNAVVVLPSITMLGQQSFQQSKMKAVDIGPNLTKLYNDTFFGGTYDTVILRSTTLVTANNRDAVRGITKLYVPSALVASYATATNWSNDAGSRTVLAIEGSQYEHAYADGTPIS